MARTLLNECIERVKQTRMKGWETADRWGVATLQTIAEKILETRSPVIRLREETIVDLIVALVATRTWTVDDGIDECKKWFEA